MNSSDDNPPPRGGATTCPPPVAPSRPSEPLAGEVLGGSYRLLSPLGEGGMASVWLAEHLRTGGKLAVKLIHARLLASPRAAQRFALEARHTASLHHPNIVRVFDYGHDADLRLLYQAMEYVPGETLADVVHRDGPMPWTRAVPILEQVLAALIAAHESERSLIHRDIKPANILLTDFEGQPGDTVKVVDFGISRALSGASAARSTRAGAVIGSPSTMAPEQWQSKPVSPATDLYALGCTAYAMLAARVPFAGERGPYSEGLALIDRVLAVEPPEDALRARLLISAGTLARSAGQPERALERFEAALRLARALNQGWLQSRALFGLGAVQRVLGQREEAQQSYERSLALGRQLGDKVLEGQALYGLGFVWRDMGQTERALEAFQDCQRLAHKARHLLLEGSALQGIGWMHGDLGRLEQARESYLACQQIARAIGHKLLEGSVLSGQGYVLKDQGRPGQALNAFAACLKLSREIGHTSLEATTLHGLGTVLADQGLWADAEDRYRACVRLSHGAGLKHVECYALSGLGYILMVQGRLDEARSAYASCVEQAQAVGHRFIEGDALAGLLASQLDLGRLDDALQTAQTLQALAEDADIPDLKTMAQLGLGRVRLAEGQLVGASDALARAAQQVRDSGNEPLMMEVGLAQADAALHQRDAAEAADLLASLLPLIDLDLHPLQALEHDALSALQLHLSGGAPRAALERAQEAVAELGLGPRSRLARLVERVRAAVAEG